MLKLIILLILPLIMFAVANKVDNKKARDHMQEQPNKRPREESATSVASTLNVQAPETLEDLFLEDDFDITDLVNRRDNK